MCLNSMIHIIGAKLYLDDFFDEMGFLGTLKKL